MSYFDDSQNSHYLAMSSSQTAGSSLVHELATLLRNHGDLVLNGSSTLTLQVRCLQQLTQLFEQHLVSRKEQHGFLCLPSHPADTAFLLELQLLFDMLQKTLSLKLVNPPGQKLQCVVKLFPFKSLKRLELKRIPPHCLEGLRAIYSQLEVFTCSRDISSLEELLSLCGGDLSSALPWLDLHTLNFSYNSISNLDKSLSLLNALKRLDLSRNHLHDCAEFLKPLSELEHLNLSYNNLQRLPQLGLSTQVRLSTLLLRNNELETIDGLEQLSSLQYLDLGYNLLMEHSHLTSLSYLHNLQTLNLEGNPLFFLKSHREGTVGHLSPHAAVRGLLLDGSPLSSSDLLILTKPGRSVCRLTPTSQVDVQSEQDGAHVFVEAGDEANIRGGKARKSKHKVKVRRPSISEPSDTDYEVRASSPSHVQGRTNTRGNQSQYETRKHPVKHEKNAQSQDDLPHTKDIERMESFRERLGEDWLCYHHHLDDVPLHPAFPRVENVPEQTDGPLTTPSPILQANEFPKPSEMFPPPLMSSEVKAAVQLETESTLQWTDHSQLSTESTLETGNAPAQPEAYAMQRPPPPEEEDDDDDDDDDEDGDNDNGGVDLCRPVLVGLLSEGPVKRAFDPVFLRLRHSVLLEVDVHQGNVQTRVDLDSLQDVMATEAACIVKEVEKSRPVMELHFNYISRERRKRYYVMLDDEPQEALQVITEVLWRVLEEHKKRLDEPSLQIVWLQCLKCQAEFSQPASECETRLPDELDDDRHDSCPLICSECRSDHVVQLAPQTALCTSTPVHSVTRDDHTKFFSFDERDTHVLVPDHCIPITPQAYVTASNGQATICSENQEEEETCSYTSHSKTNSDQNQLDTQFAHCIEASTQPLFDLTTEVVDHRLQLFLDVEVFGKKEQLRCSLKMSVVKFGDVMEIQSFVVISNQYIYIFEIISQSEEEPSHWLCKRGSHALVELSYLELALGSQALHLEFNEASASYTLLIRNRARCKWFFSKLTEIAAELVPDSCSELKGISTVRLNPQHHLWPLVCEDKDPEDCHPPYRYLLVFLQQDGALEPVSVLATEETILLLQEDHQWRKTISNQDAHHSRQQVEVKEAQQISCISSLHLFSTDPHHINLNFYDEMTKKEKAWSIRAEDEELLQDLVKWVRTRWETMFGVKLATVLQ